MPLSCRLPARHLIDAQYPDNVKGSACTQRARLQRCGLCNAQSHACQAICACVPAATTSPQITETSRRTILISLLCSAPLTLYPQRALAGLIDEQQADKVFARANQSVVAVADYRTNNGSETSEGTGSGFIWDSYGHVVTNYHCIAKLATDKAGSQVHKLQSVGHALNPPLLCTLADAVLGCARSQG